MNGETQLNKDKAGRELTYKGKLLKKGEDDGYTETNERKNGKTDGTTNTKKKEKTSSSRPTLDFKSNPMIFTPKALFIHLLYFCFGHSC